MSVVRQALISTMSIQSIATASTVTLSAIAPLVATAIGMPSSFIGTYVCFIYIGAAFAAVAGGTMVTRYGGIHVSQGCLILAAIGLMLSSIANFWFICLGGLCLGLSYGPITPASSDILAHTVPKERMGFVFSLKQTAVPLGSALAGFIVPSIALWAGSWQAGPHAMAIFALCIALLVLYHRNQLDDHFDPSSRFSIHTVLNALRLVTSHSGLRRMCIVSFVYNGTQMCVFSYLVSFMVEDISISIVLAGMALSAASIGGMCGRLFWGMFADWIHSPRLTLAILGFLMAAMLVTVGFFTPETATVLLLGVCFCLGASAIGWNGVYLAHVARIAPEGKAGVATGGTLFFTFAGAIFLPLAFGFIHGTFNQYFESFYATAALCALIALWLLVSKNAKN